MTNWKSFTQHQKKKEKWDLIEIVSGEKEHRYISAGNTSSINNYALNLRGTS
jgi:hypothetical protein